MHSRIFNGSPFNFLEELLEFFAAGGIYGLEVGNAAEEVGTEIGDGSAVLGGWAGADAVGEGGFELVELAAGDIEVVIEGEAGGVLAEGRFHDAGFACVHFETFFEDDGAGFYIEALDGADEARSAGEEEVIQALRFARAGEVEAPWGRWTVG